LAKGKRSYLKDKEVKLILERISKILYLAQTNFIDDNSKFEAMSLTFGGRVFFVDEIPSFIEFGNEIFPTLFNERVLSKIPSLTVNIGAVPYICNGADVMAPGVTKINGDFEIGRIITISEEKFSKKIAVVRALYRSQEIIGKQQGKVAENLHYVSDKFWEALKQ
jgi:PUA domain protein